LRTLQELWLNSSKKDAIALHKLTVKKWVH
jgi:hypothetical protein